MDKINNIGLSRLMSSVYDFNGLTEQEIWCRIAQKINIIIEHFNYIDNKVDNEIDKNKIKFDYLLGEGLNEQIAKELIKRINDGTLGNIINNTLLKDIQKTADDTKQYVIDRIDSKKTFGNVNFLNSTRDEGAILIQTSNNKNILIDCGETFNAEKLKNKLYAMNVKTIDYLIITHFHSDHVGGFEMLADNFKINEVIYREVHWASLPPIEIEWGTIALVDLFNRKCRDLKINKRCLSSDTTIQISENESLHFYNTKFIDYKDYNSSSLMILYNYNNTYTLFTGDITVEAINNYINVIPKVSCYIMPHHGGWINTSTKFVQSIRPRISISHGLGLQNSKEYLLVSKWACDSRTFVMNHYHESGVGGFIVNSNGVYMCDDIKEILYSNEKFLFDGKYYLIGSDGNLIFEGIHEHKGNLYYIKNYEIQVSKGWIKIDDEWYFCQPNGELMRDMWKQSEVSETINNYYRLGYNGKMIKDTALILEGKLIWFDENGVASPSPIE